MDIVAVFFASVHLLACLIVGFLGLLVIGFGENRTPAEQEEAERVGLAMLAVLPLAIAMVILLGFRLQTLAAVAYAVQVLLGVFVVLHFGVLTPGSLLFALGVAGTGLGMLWATASMRARERRFA